MHESCFVRVSEPNILSPCRQAGPAFGEFARGARAAIQPATGSELPAGRGFFEPGPISAAISRR
jgi:hypothetical protein